MDTIFADGGWRLPDLALPAPRPRIAPPPLIGDLVTARAGVAVLLIDQCRIERRDDPGPFE